MDGNVNAWVIDLHDLFIRYHLDLESVSIWATNWWLWCSFADAGCLISIGVPCQMACELRHPMCRVHNHGTQETCLKITGEDEVLCLSLLFSNSYSRNQVRFQWLYLVLLGEICNLQSSILLGGRLETILGLVAWGYHYMHLAWCSFSSICGYSDFQVGSIDFIRRGMA